MYYGTGYDIIIIGITLLITLCAQGYINSTYNRCKKISTNKRISGREVARKILDENGLKKVKIEEVPGELSDHYDPRNKVVRLSSAIYSESTIASLSVAAHECGHAIQDKNGYFFLRLRNSIIPLVNFSSTAGYIAIMVGLIFSLTKLIWIGIILEAVILAFQLITLPVEFNASRRGIKQLTELGLVGEGEKDNCKKMLTAAALTYVASVATAILQILRLVLIARRND